MEPSHGTPAFTGCTCALSLSMVSRKRASRSIIAAFHSRNCGLLSENSAMSSTLAQVAGTAQLALDELIERI